MWREEATSTALCGEGERTQQPSVYQNTHIGSDLQKVLFKVLFWALFLGKELFLALFWALIIVPELFFALFCALLCALF